MAAIGCAGILVADTFCGPMKKLPDQGQLLALDAMVSRAGGCTANVAIDLARQDMPVDVVGCLGRDAPAGVVLSQFQDHGIGIEYMAYTDEYPTSQTVILLVEGEDRRYLHIFGANQAFRIGQIDRDWVEGLKVFYLGGLFAMPAVDMDELLDLLKFCRAHQVATVIDVVIPQGVEAAGELPSLLPYIDYFLPNDDEARELTGQTEARDQVRALLELGAHTVILTCGERGALAARGSDIWQCGVYPAEVVDPSGPGDAFAAGVLVGLERGWDMPELLRYSSALGSSATRAIGTTDGVFTAREAREFIAANPLEVARLSERN